MAYDSGQGSYHLTPRGWIRGTQPPPNRLETWDYYMYQASGWSKEVFNFERVWINEAVSEAQRDAARQKFGPPLLSNSTRDVSLKCFQGNRERNEK